MNLSIQIKNHVLKWIKLFIIVRSMLKFGSINWMNKYQFVANVLISFKNEFIFELIIFSWCWILFCFQW